MKTKEYKTVYTDHDDITFVMSETRIDGELAEQECIGWHYGRPEENDTINPGCGLVARFRSTWL